MSQFKLTDKFIEEYKTKEVKWGYEGLSLAVYKRTYARQKADGSIEDWWETVQRVVEGVYSIQKKHCDSMRLEWNGHKSQKSAQIMFSKMFNFKFTPPGRGLWAMGTAVVDKLGSGALNNCGMASTQNIDIDFAEPFVTVMDFSMIGVGMGFDTRGANKIKIKAQKEEAQPFVVPDSREGWCECLSLLLNSFNSGPNYLFDFSEIRPEGSPIRTFGGIAPGPKPLKDMVKDITKILTLSAGREITSVNIVDVMNLVGRCVVAGGVRRSALLSLGNADDSAYIEMKDPAKYKAELKSHRWSSNNSVLGEVGMNYEEISKNISKNGEPGVVWLENIHSFGRKIDGFSNKDYRVVGCNPCLTSYFTFTTRTGLVELKDLSVGTEVWTGKQYAPVSKIWSNGTKDVYRYYLSNNTHLDCTPNHRVVSNGEKIEIQNAEFLDLSNPTEELKSTKIERSEPIGPMEVFDFTVDAPEHTAEHKGLLISNCGEMVLENSELCCLVECYPAHHDSEEEWIETLKYAYLYAKSVTLVPTHRQKTNAVMMRNRRIGVSMSGIDQAITKFGRRRFLKNFCDAGYKKLLSLDNHYSEWLCIPQSIRLSTTKPSGTISLLAGAFPGIHRSHSKRYIRNVRYQKVSPYVAAFKKAGYLVEDDYYDEYSCVVSFPIEEKNFRKSKYETSMLEQFIMLADMQYYWSDNAVSCTITFTEEEKKDIAQTLEMFETQLKTVSMLPLENHSYVQAPYITVEENPNKSSVFFKDKYKILWTLTEFEEYKKQINSKTLEKEINKISQDGMGEKFCDGDKCDVSLGAKQS